jgi:hypothetical protein
MIGTTPSHPHTDTQTDSHVIIRALVECNPHRPLIDTLEKILEYMNMDMNKDGHNKFNGIVFLRCVMDNYSREFINKVLTDELVFLKLQL